MKKYILFVFILGAMTLSQAMEKEGKKDVRITRELLGLPVTASRQDFIEGTRQLANVLLLQEILYNDCKEYQKASRLYFATEEDLRRTCKSALEIAWQGNSSTFIFKPEPEIETIDGLMAIINYRQLLRSADLSDKDQRTISLLQQSTNTECKTIGLWLSKKLAYSKACAGSRLFDSYVTAILKRLSLLPMQQFLANTQCQTLIRSIDLLNRAFSTILSETEREAEELAKQSEPVSPETLLDRRRAHEKNFAFTKITIMLNIYEQVRETALAYYTQARQLLLKDRSQATTLLRLIGNHSEIPLSESKSIKTDATDSLPSKIEGLRGQDLPGIKDTAQSIDELMKEESEMLRKSTLAQQDTVSPEDRGALCQLLQQSSPLACPPLTCPPMVIPQDGIQPTEKPVSPEQTVQKAIAPTPQKTKKKKQKQECLTAQDIAPAPQEFFAEEKKEEQAVYAPIAPAKEERLGTAISFELEKIIDGKRKKKKAKEIAPDTHEQPAATCAEQPIKPHDQIIDSNQFRIVIRDVTHNILLHIYLPQVTASKITPRKRIVYTDTIEKWRTDPDAVLYEKGITNPRSPLYKLGACYSLPLNNPNSLNRYRLVHNFSRLVDEFILAHGLRQSQLPAGLIRKGSEASVLPGHVEYPDGQQESCLYCYLFSDFSNALCYHRNIDFRPRAQLSRDFLEKGYFTIKDSSK